MQCSYFDSGQCRSCTLMGVPYDAQVAAKIENARALLSPWPGATWLAPFASRSDAFRNRAKMVAGGRYDAPTLGILGPFQEGVDLSDCGILLPELRAAFDPIKEFISRARIVPYDVASRRGELKNVLLTAAPSGSLMLRFVLRSTEPVGRMKKHLQWLLDTIPNLSVVTANLLPQHKAVVEGDEEVHLSGDASLGMDVGALVLHLKPASFFQTNTEVAIGLYRQARDWIDGVSAQSVLDLYCGVGGFALHVAKPGRKVHGIEVSAPAIDSAERSARDAGLENVSFAVGDATAMDSKAGYDAVIVNPPRRGLGDRLCAALNASGALTIVYSSCNAQTLVKDLEALQSYAPDQIRVFDMFPQTEHYEVMVLLKRRSV